MNAYRTNPYVSSETIRVVRCARCGRKLTALTSVLVGVGPMCRRDFARYFPTPALGTFAPFPSAPSPLEQLCVRLYDYLSRRVRA